MMKNEHESRFLSTSQRAYEAAEEYKRVKSSGGKITYSGVAQKYGVSARHTRTMVGLLDTETPETLQAIEEGRVRINKIATSGQRKCGRVCRNSTKGGE